MSAAALRLALEAIGWTAGELARRLGCHRATVAEWLDGLADHHATNPAPAWRALRDAAWRRRSRGAGEQSTLA